MREKKLTLPLIWILLPTTCKFKSADTKAEKVAVASTKSAKSVSISTANDEYVTSDEVVATPEATEKVNLILLTEAGCPYCQQMIAGPLNDMITSPGFADILIVRQFR